MSNERRILAIEDNPDHVFLIEEMLHESTTSAGLYCVEQATSMEDALDRIRNGNYDAVLLDLNLPDSPVERTFAHLSRISRERPVVVLTAHDDRETAQTAVLNGAQEFLCKDDLAGRTLQRAVDCAITKFKQFHDLDVLATTDDLTGLPNRRGLTRSAVPLLRPGLWTTGVAVAMFVDVEDMKRINRSWGHAEGNRAIVDAAEVLRAVVRPPDIAARWGGDEFVILARAGSPRKVEALKTAIADALARFIRDNPRPYLLQLQIGTAVAHLGRPFSLGELIATADDAMTQARRRREIEALVDEANAD